MSHDVQQPLPGLELEAPSTPAGGVTPLEAAARRSLAALAVDGGLTEAHALPMQLVLDLAGAVGRAAAKGQGAAAAMAAAQLREAYQLLLPELPDVKPGDSWDELAAELREAAQLERTRAREAGQ